jgi:hypothetical protein
LAEPLITSRSIFSARFARQARYAVLYEYKVRVRCRITG